MSEREIEGNATSYEVSLLARIDALMAAKASSAKRIAELEAELAEQAKVLVANVDKQLALEEKLEAMPKPKQPYPNHNWCVGCTPETCQGCGTEPIERRAIKKQEPTAFYYKSWYKRDGESGYRWHDELSEFEPESNGWDWRNFGCEEKLGFKDITPLYAHPALPVQS